jgi:hypothetical protein
MKGEEKEEAGVQLDPTTCCAAPLAAVEHLQHLPGHSEKPEVLVPQGLIYDTSSLRPRVRF